ncbi:hypothetical protein F5146DRAFT_1165092 [Armillaria mellea]|nr:hypothetical protein F5146DRAFT_1165092 [Armillaria mellea]
MSNPLFLNLRNLVICSEVKPHDKASTGSDTSSLTVDKTPEFRLEDTVLKMVDDKTGFFHEEISDGDIQMAEKRKEALLRSGIEVQVPDSQRCVKGLSVLMPGVQWRMSESRSVKMTSGTTWVLDEGRKRAIGTTLSCILTRSDADLLQLRQFVLCARVVGAKLNDMQSGGVLEGFDANGRPQIMAIDYQARQGYMSPGDSPKFNTRWEDRFNATVNLETRTLTTWESLPWPTAVIDIEPVEVGIVLENTHVKYASEKFNKSISDWDIATANG